MIDIKRATAKLLKEYYQLDEPTVLSLFDFGILTEQASKRILIREEFNKRRDIAQKQILKTHLADKYCVSLSTIEKYLAGKPDQGAEICP